MTTEPTSFGAELIRTILEHGPRRTDAEPSIVLMALYDAAGAYWDTVDVDADGENAFPAITAPVIEVLTRYRPTTLRGVATYLEFFGRFIDDEISGHSVTMLSALLDGVKTLEQLEANRWRNHGIKALALDSPRVGGYQHLPEDGRARHD